MRVRSLEFLLDDLGHLDVDDEDLVEQHRDHLALVRLVVRVDLRHLLRQVVLRTDQLLVLRFFLHTRTRF